MCTVAHATALRSHDMRTLDCNTNNITTIGYYDVTTIYIKFDVL